MFGLVRTAVRFFLIGVGVGVLLAPRSGVETRRLIQERVQLITDSVLEVADLPQNGAGGSARRTSQRQPPRVETGATRG